MDHSIVDSCKSGFPQTSLEKPSMIFQWYFKTKLSNFYDDSECHKTEKHRTTCYAWPPLHILCQLLAAFQKIDKSLPAWFEKKNILVNNVCITYIFFTHVVSQNYLYHRIQWFFHEWLIQNSMIFPWFFHFYKFQELFMKVNDISMILKQIWISIIF